jgi:hypothetical protein
MQALPYCAGYGQPMTYMQTEYVQPVEYVQQTESGWGAADVAMLAVAGAAVGAAVSNRFKSRAAAAAPAEADVELAMDTPLVSAPGITARAGPVTMFQEGDIGVTLPLGVYDPLGLIATKDMRRFEIMEIKHGRAAMLGFLHIILIHAGVRLPGYLSIQQDLKFADMPVGCFDSLEATPTLGWLQIMAVTCAAETGYAGTTAGLVKQLPDKAPGDIGGSKWKRYADPEERAFKLNAERNNGRAAMLGVTGCLIHELLGVDPLYPTGGLDGAAPPTIF